MKNKQILILTIESDVSTDNVIRWIRYMNPSVDVIRLHPEHLISGLLMHDLSENYIKLKFDDTLLDSDMISSVWMRKWHSDIVTMIPRDKKIRQSIDVLKKNMLQEYNEVCQYLLFIIEQNKNIRWLNHPRYISPNKLVQLKLAKEVGLEIPQSYISNIVPQKTGHSSLITKPISNCCNIRYDGDFYNNYTWRIDEKNISKDLFISFFQEEISKLFEIRIFYLDEICYALAIHSQDNNKTKIDYRQYDYNSQNRLEYFHVPFFLQQKIIKFMKKMNLQTGSLDFIYTPDDEYVFLEVNPCGQYDIFNSCNVHPDKLIAENLINKTI